MKKRIALASLSLALITWGAATAPQSDPANDDNCNIHSSPVCRCGHPIADHHLQMGCMAGWRFSDRAVSYGCECAVSGIWMGFV
jgi:hypothetical protein